MIFFGNDFIDRMFWFAGNRKPQQFIPAEFSVQSNHFDIAVLNREDGFRVVPGIFRVNKVCAKDTFDPLHGVRVVGGAMLKRARAREFVELWVMKVIDHVGPGHCARGQLADRRRHS